MNRKRYRVAQWATGNVGLHAMAKVIEHPDMDLVGVLVYSPAKAGLDAGDLCGLPPTGVMATTRIEDILAARPDCVLYMPSRPEIDLLCRLLEAGINVVTSLVMFGHRDSLNPEWRCLLEDACARGGATLYATGSTPGFSTETLPFAFTAIMRRLDGITQTECCDMSSRNSPEILFDILGFGSDPAKIRPLANATTSLGPSLRMTAEALSIPLDDLFSTYEYAVATQGVDIAAGRIEAGTVAAIRMDLVGTHDGKEVIRRRAIWYLTRELDPKWDMPPDGWHYLIEGDVPMEVSISHPVSEEYYPKMTPGMTANPAVNALPYVCQADPGIRHTSELPLVLSNFSRSVAV